MEEVAASAAAGELGGYTTGAVLTNAMSLCRDLASYRRGLEWSDAARRWLARQPIRGFAGICGIHRSQLSCMLGNFTDALADVSRACDEVGEVSLVHAGLAQHELGEVRLRLGDLDGAAVAFEHAQELGEDPQPGLALLRLAQDDPSAALSSIDRSLEGAAFDGFARARMLAAQAEIAAAAADTERARAARDELRQIAEQLPSPAVRAASAWADGLAALAEDDPEIASRDLRGTRSSAGARSPHRTKRRKRRLRSPRQRCCGATRTTPRRGSRAPAARSSAWGRRRMHGGRVCGKNGSDAGDRRPGSFGRSSSRTSSARRLCWG